MWTAAILAGGQARRLGGRDKSALIVGGIAILDRQLSVLRPLTRQILLVSGPAPAPGPAGARPSAADVQVVEDRIVGAGALGGLYTALSEAPTEQVLVIACDMPFISAPLLTALAARGAGVDAAIPRDRRRQHPLCASYQRRLAPHFKRCIDAGALRITDALRELHLADIGPDELDRIDPGGRALFNVNTPDDYERTTNP